jgi:MFS family permease
MKERLKKGLPILGVICGACLVLAAVVLGEQLPKGMSGVLFGTGGALMGLGVAGIAMDVVWRRMSEEERREVERGETDERNVAIREKAAYSSWYWTLYLLWGAFFITLFLGSGFPTALVSVLIVLHCVFLMVNMNRWTKRM